MPCRQTQNPHPPNWLPVELIEKILTEAWALPLAPSERMSLFNSLSLVNHLWLRMFMRVALIDVYIDSVTAADWYIYLLRERSSGESDNDYFLDNASAMANRLCQSITFHVGGGPFGLKPSNTEDRAGPKPGVTLYSHTSHSGDAISMLLYMIDNLNYTPNLRRVVLEYFDWGFDDVFDQCRLVPLPIQVTHLELRYQFSDNLSRVADSVRRRYHRETSPEGSMSPWTTPNVRTLSISGAPISFVSALVGTCPNLERLELLDQFELDGLRTTLPKLEAVILRYRDTWKLDAELREEIEDVFQAGLFSHPFPPSKPRLIIHSRSEPSGVDKLCAKFGVDFIFLPNYS
ncbi:hypothetical protein C8Q75DRAFT_731934 [Abortiporus biennis]|nr:hypothetical protein C8Q75DRAFT_731934 [Abortiporus biennis]